MAAEDELRVLNLSIHEVLNASGESLRFLARTAGLDPLTHFRGADFRGMDLSDEDLRGFDLSGADFRGARLKRAILVDANIRGATFENADLSGANLRGTELAGANLAGADLTDAEFDRPLHRTESAATTLKDLSTRVRQDRPSTASVRQAAHSGHPTSGSVVSPLGTMNVVRLLEEHEISQATGLVAPPGGWPEPGDRAGLEVRVGEGGRIHMEGQYDLAAQWIGFWRDGSLRAVHRVCWTRDGKLPVERYGVVLPATLKRFNVVEVNCLRSLDAMALLMLLRGAFEWLAAQGADFVLTTATYPSPRDLFVELGMHRTAVQFRYPESDRNPVELLVAPLATSEMSRLWHVTDRLTARQARRAQA